MPTAQSPRKSVRTEALKLVRTLPRDASWDDLMYRVYVRQKVENGLADLKARRVHSHAAVRKEFGLEK